jgi:predicted RNA-binding Zn-ribbon protein involved in translation (DUF1610 family)
MMGRYGGDQLSMALLILSVVLTLIGDFARIPLLALIGYIPLGIGIFRILSRNINKRRMENYKFMTLMSPVYSRFKEVQYWAKESKTHRRFKCPNCGTKLWVPKGKGKIIVTCPKCKTDFKKRT